MRSIHLFQICLLIALICGAYLATDTYGDRKPVTVTVIAKMEVEHGYKSRIVSRPVVGVRTDDGRLFDVELSVAQYSQWNVGDRLNLMRSDYDLNPNGWKLFLGVISILGVTFGVTLGTIFGCFAFKERND